MRKVFGAALFFLFAPFSWAVEPPILLLSLSFEKAALGTYNGNQAKADCRAPWSQGLDPGRATVERDSDGRRFLRVHYSAGVVGGAGGVQFPCPLPPSDEMTAEYAVRFGDGYDFIKGGKLPGLCGGKCNTGGKKPTGDGWSARYMWRAQGRVVVYLYHLDQPGDYGEDLPLNASFLPGRWHVLRQHLRINTPGKKDGVLQVWVDGVLALDRHDIRYRGVASAPIDRLYFSTFFGGDTPDWAPGKAQQSDFADFRVLAP